jgi:hypothetical protein
LKSQLFLSSNCQIHSNFSLVKFELSILFVLTISDLHYFELITSPTSLLIEFLNRLFIESQFLQRISSLFKCWLFSCYQFDGKRKIINNFLFRSLHINFDCWKNTFHSRMKILSKYSSSTQSEDSSFNLLENNYSIYFLCLERRLNCTIVTEFLSSSHE